MSFGLSRKPEQSGISIQPIQIPSPKNNANPKKTGSTLIVRAPPAFLFYFFAAFTNPTNSGPGLLGLDFNSGWNCPAIKYGCSGISTISTNNPSGEVPDTFNPAFSNLSL